jgi:hypothetical protein
VNASIPEEAIVDAVLSDPLVAATLVVHLANRDSLSIRAGLLDDIARDQNITSQKLESILEALLAAGLLAQMQGGIALAVPKSDACGTRPCYVELPMHGIASGRLTRSKSH